MILTPIEVPPLDLSESDEAGEVRSPGLHLTTIIRDIERTVWPQKYREEFTEEQLGAFAQVGFAWERIVGRIWRDIAIKRSGGSLVRPGEFERDGIICSPDALDLEEWVIEEYKARWASASHDIRDVLKYWIQIKGYCHVVGTRRARLWVWYVCGNWRPPVPIVRAWEAEFSERELEDNWSMLVCHARAKGWL